MKNKKKRKLPWPWFWRRRESCPSCGQTEKYHDEFLEMQAKNPAVFICPRCHEHFSWEEFGEENWDKNSLLMKEEYDE